MKGYVVKVNKFNNTICRINKNFRLLRAEVFNFLTCGFLAFLWINWMAFFGAGFH